MTAEDILNGLAEHGASIWGWLAAGPILAIIPPLLHFSDKLLERTHLLKHHAVFGMLKADPRPHVSGTFPSLDHYKDVRTYFRFDHDAHFVISLLAFCVISLLVASLACGLSRWLIIPAIGVTASIGLGVSFLFRVHTGGFNMAARDPTARWRNAMYLWSVVVIGAEILLHFMCETAH